MNTTDNDTTNNDNAVSLIRAKLSRLYANEPDAVEEIIEITNEKPTQISKHQKFMQSLTNSNRSMAEIQTEWHNYYVSLSDREKHEVWEEFYSAKDTVHKGYEHEAAKEEERTVISEPTVPTQAHITNPEQPTELMQTAATRVKKKLSKKQQLKSLAFGLGMGGIFVFIFMFGFFNERFIAPFITPNRIASATPLIITDSTPVGKESKIIIPKINVEAPVVLDVATLSEEDIQSGLERGVVHYVTTANPGEKGNSVIFGHSSNNILNKGDYKFVFVLLSKLEENDVFYVETGGIRYSYKIFSKKVVKPNDFSVLDPIEGKSAVMTLITCDPPGTATNRLVITAEQVSPDPLSNQESTAVKTDQAPDVLPSNSPSLLRRVINWVF